MEASGSAPPPGVPEKFPRLTLALWARVPYSISSQADMAQLVEHNLAKVGVAGSSPVVRSIAHRAAGSHGGPAVSMQGDVAKR